MPVSARTAAHLRPPRPDASVETLHILARQATLLGLSRPLRSRILLACMHTGAWGAVDGTASKLCSRHPPGILLAALCSQQAASCTASDALIC